MGSCGGGSCPRLSVTGSYPPPSSARMSRVRPERERPRVPEERLRPISWAASRSSAGRPTAPNSLECRGEQVRDILVAALRDGDAEFAVGAPIDAGGTPGPRPDASGQPAVGSLQQAGIGELVEMERGEGARQAGCRGRLLAADRLVLRGHPVVEPATRGLVQQAKRGEVVSSGIGHVADSITHIH